MKARKNESEEAQSFVGVRRNFSKGRNVGILFIIFKLLRTSVPSQFILHWANICFNDNFRAE